MSEKARILLLIDWYSPGYRAGGPIRSCVNIVDQLKDQYDFCVVTQNTDYHSDRPYEGITPDQWIQKDGVDLYYFSKDKLNYAAIKKLIKERQPDLIYLNSLFSWYFTLLPIWMNSKTPVVIAPRGMAASTALSIKRWKKAPFIFLMKGTWKSVLFHVSSKKEQQDVEQNLSARANSIVAPNLPAPLQVECSPIIKAPRAMKLISVARISPEKNLLFALKMLQGLRGNIEMDIYGTVNNKAYWEECQSVIRKLGSDIKVEYRGELAHKEVSGKFENSHLLFMPSLGENFGHSILESLSAGRPVLISDKTPWRGLEQDLAGWDISLEQADQFRSSLQQLCDMDQNDYDKWSKGAYQRAKRYRDDPQLIQKTKQVFETALKKQ